VKALTSTVAGSAIGVVTTIFLVGTPVGWGVILTVGAVSAVTAWGAGELASSIYKSQFSDTDVVNSLGINKYCN